MKRASFVLSTLLGLVLAALYAPPGAASPGATRVEAAAAAGSRNIAVVEHPFQSNRGYPRYCCTDAGVLGPYPNDTVPEGGACFGTKGGRRYEGTACHGEADDEKSGEKRYPKYCCTDAGKLGPYDNDSVPEGGACFGTKGGRRYEGTACS